MRVDMRPPQLASDGCFTYFMVKKTETRLLTPHYCPGASGVLARDCHKQQSFTVIQSLVCNQNLSATLRDPHVEADLMRAWGHRVTICQPNTAVLGDSLTGHVLAVPLSTTDLTGTPTGKLSPLHRVTWNLMSKLQAGTRVADKAITQPQTQLSADACISALKREAVKG
jgi:hypothetical protein